MKKKLMIITGITWLTLLMLFLSLNEPQIIIQENKTINNALNELDNTDINLTISDKERMKTVINNIFLDEELKNELGVYDKLSAQELIKLNETINNINNCNQTSELINQLNTTLNLKLSINELNEFITFITGYIKNEFCTKISNLINETKAIEVIRGINLTLQYLINEQVINNTLPENETQKLIELIQNKEYTQDLITEFNQELSNTIASNIIIINNSWTHDYITFTVTFNTGLAFNEFRQIPELTSQEEFNDEDLIYLMNIIINTTKPANTLSSKGINTAYNTKSFPELDMIISNEPGYLISYNYQNSMYLIVFGIKPINYSQALNQIENNLWTSKETTSRNWNVNAYCISCNETLYGNPYVLDCSNCVNNQVITSISNQEIKIYILNDEARIALIQKQPYMIGLYFRARLSKDKELFNSLTNSLIKTTQTIMDKI